MTRIKICGIMTSEELLEAISAGTDAVGFVVQIDDSRHCLSARQNIASGVSVAELFPRRSNTRS